MREQARHSMISKIAAAFLAAALCASADGQSLFDDRVVVSCPNGLGPGDFMYLTIPGFNIFPRAFAVGSDGALYLAQEGRHSEVRIQKFREWQGFVVMHVPVSMTGCIAYHGIAVSDSGDIFVTVQPTPDCERVIDRYSREGEFIYRLGCRGVLARKLRLEDVREAFYRKSGSKEFFPHVVRMFPTSDAGLVVESMLRGETTVYRFGREGNLVDQATLLPPEVAEQVRRHDAGYDKLVAAMEAQGKKPPAKSLTRLAPDGHLYYMVYDRKKLEIHRITFKDGE